MKPTREQLLAYIQALEATNRQLVFSLKKCLELLAHVPPEVADSNQWKQMLDDFNRIVEVGEKAAVENEKTIH